MTYPGAGLITDIRLATTEAGLANGYLVFSWQLPSPTLPVYNDHSARVDLAGGGQSLRGFQNLVFSWDRLGIQQLNVLSALVGAALDTANGVLFATISKGWNGTGKTGDWIDVSGRPHPVRSVPVGGSHGLMFDDVALTLGNLTIVNDPASF